jgi:NAD(P)H-hydrate repair Nnr-like enzyme with NAD(P)H-hydrate dehydratase domain
LLDERFAKALARDVASRMAPAATLVLDAAALAGAGARENTIITPHIGEMANLLGIDKAKIGAEPWTYARIAAEQFGCVAALKGATTYVVSPGDEHTYEYADGTVGLATSGSGDTLAGIVTGIAGRGADPLAAALWGVFAHGTAGRNLGRKVARLGFLAREVLDELPPILS